MDTHVIQYHELGVTAVTCNVNLKANGKKELSFASKWREATYSNCLMKHVRPNDKGVALITGESSDLIVLDLDSTGGSDDGPAAWDRAQQMFGHVHGVPTVTTPSGGKHLYFSLIATKKAGLENCRNRAGICLCANDKPVAADIRGEGGIILAPPTSYAKGSYEWETAFRTPLPAMPSWLIASLNRKRVTDALIQRAPQPMITYDENKGSRLLQNMRSMLREELGLVGEPYLTGLRTRGCNFKFANPPRCWCHHTHDSNCWWMDEFVDGTVIVRNHSPKCSNRILNLPISKTLTQMLRDPGADDYYVEVFVKSECIEGRHWVYDDKNFLFHDGALWRAVDEAVARRQMWKSVEKVCDTLEKATRDIPLDKNEMDWHKQVLCCRKHIHRAKARRSMTDAAHDVIGDETIASRMDADPHLLGCENGVLDLRTGELHCSPDFLVSKSVGYDYFDADRAPLESTIHDVEKFIAQVYPDPGERRLFQQYAGYCAYGKQPSKYLLILTDQRDGFNGKSTMAKMLQQTLGEYAMSGDNRFLYKTDGNRETANAHGAGLLAFRGKRLAVFEELDRNKRINQQDLKTLTGGEEHMVSARAPGAVGTAQFEWTARFLLCFNEGDLPSFDTQDGAFVHRILAIPHRSRFYMTDEEYEDHKHEPYTFRGMDEFASRHFPAWKPYFLRWLVEGYRIWNEERFNTIPPGCLALKQALVEQKNELGHFLRDTTVRTNSQEDRISQKDLWEAYKTWSDGQGGLKKPDFCRGLKRTLAAFHMPDMHSTTCRGEGYNKHTFK